MANMKITLLIDRPTDPPIPFAAGPETYQRFAEELSTFAGTTVQIVRDAPVETLLDGYVLWVTSGDPASLLSRCDRVSASRLAARTVLLEGSWQKALEQLEKYRFAGAVDSLRMSEWLARPSSCKGPFGLRYLAKPLGARCSTLPWFRSEHYCLLESEQHRGMPHLLADYLAAYDRDRKPLSTVPYVVVARRAELRADESAPKEEMLVERENTRLVIASLKYVREHMGMTLLQVSESMGLDLEELTLLEGGYVEQTTLATLRGYALAVESQWGWSLVGAEETASSGPRRVHSRTDKADAQGRGMSTSGKTERAVTPESTGWHEQREERPMVVGGMTAYTHRRVRRRRSEEELGRRVTWAQKEGVHAGV
jgi:hypothetical protein